MRMPISATPGGKTPAITRGPISRVSASPSAPLFSSCYSISDALYSTCWADSECGSVPNIDYRVPWRYGYLAAGFLLSLLPAAAILVGTAAAIVQFVRRPTSTWALLLALMFLAVVFVVHVALTVPAFGLKAFYRFGGHCSVVCVGCRGARLPLRPAAMAPHGNLHRAWRMGVQ